MLPRTLVFSAAIALASFALHAETVRIAYIDPLTGPAAALGANDLATFRAVVDIANQNHWAGDNTLEVVPFDGKGSPPESLQQLKNATDQGIRYVAQALGSNVAIALIDAVNKYNDRNPGKEVLFLDVLGSSTELTNELCSFWHFRFADHINMQTETLIGALAKDKSLKKVYLINQNYATGQGVSTSAKATLKRLRPDIEIVGDDLIPMMQIKDFSPYVAKIKSSGADVVVTGNWSGDLTLLLRAAKDSNLQIPFFTYFGGSKGIPTALGAAQITNVNSVIYWNPNDDLAASKDILESFNKKYDDDFTSMPFYTATVMLAQAIRQSQSTEPLKVAMAMEGMKSKSLNGEVEMRAADHQILQPAVVAAWTRVDGNAVKFEQEKTGFGWKTIDKVPAAANAQPTTCRMKRPAT